MAQRTFELAAGTELVIELSEMGSAGYLWALDDADPAVARLTELAVPDSEWSGLVGGPKHLSVRVEGIAAGTTTIRHARPWNKTDQADSVDIVVR